MKLRILSSALKDLESGRAFYEEQGPGLGNYFFDSVFADVDSLALYGEIHRKCLGYYRLLTRRFPFAIYYRMDTDDQVVVYRILDCRQDPAKTAGQLRRS